MEKELNVILIVWPNIRNITKTDERFFFFYYLFYLSKFYFVFINFLKQIKNNCFELNNKKYIYVDRSLCNHFASAYQ